MKVQASSREANWKGLLVEDLMFLLEVNTCGVQEGDAVIQGMLEACWRSH